MSAARTWRVCVMALICGAAAGCRHKPQAAVIPIPPPQQLPVDTTAKTEGQPTVATVPLQPAPMPTVTVPTVKAKRTKKSAAPAPAQVAGAAGVPPPPGAPPPPANVIGALAPGGEQAPQMKRDAMELMAAQERRLAGLPADVKEQQRDQLQKVRNFLRDAQRALDAGDADGAMTLATKAKVLLDDLGK